MNLTVKHRIAIVMAALVLVNTASAALSYLAFQQASRHAATAREAAKTVRDAETTSLRLTQFISDGRALAFALSRSDVSADSSVAYGRLTRSEADIVASLRAIKRSGDPRAEQLATLYEQVRETTFLWINREAQIANKPLRLTKDRGGRWRASVSSNIVEPARIASMSDIDLSREVRDSTERLKNSTLRHIVRDAEKTAAAATSRERAAREGAVRVTVALALLALVMAVFATTWLYRSIALPLQQAREYADLVAGGELGATFPAHRSDEIGALTQAVEAMKDAVVHRIATMREMAGAVLVTAEAVRDEAQAADEPAVVEGAEVLLGLAGQMLES